MSLCHLSEFFASSTSSGNFHDFISLTGDWNPLCLDSTLSPSADEPLGRKIYLDSSFFFTDDQGNHSQGFAIPVKAMSYLPISYAK